MKITTHFHQIWKRKRRYPDENWLTYLFFATLRVVLVFIPQLGYVHPDEFFQSVEVMTGETFQVEHVRTWEFNHTMPIRSVFLPILLYRVPWSFVEFFGLYLRELLKIEILNSYTYLVFPRLLMCVMSFANDWSLYRVCRLYSLRHKIRLLALGSSHIMLIYGTRTFSNTIEMTLCSLLLCLVAECMIKTNTIVYKKEYLDERYEKAGSIGERVRIWKLKNRLPTHNFTHLFLLSTACVAGVFNRPTFLVFGAPMVFYWMLRGMGTKTITFRDFNLRMLYFCLCAVPAVISFVFCDSIYYRYLTIGELQMLDFGLENFVFTPWNFVKYNLNPNNTAQHGVHPHFMHVLINIPLLYNGLGVVALVSFGNLLIRFLRAQFQGLPRAQSIVSLMSAAIFVPLFFLSLINHQEPRFLIPLTVPIMLLHAPKLITGFCATYPFKGRERWQRFLYENLLCQKVSARNFLRAWYSCNLFLTVFYGFIHQAGVFPLAQHFEREMQLRQPGDHIHLITSHTYKLPVSFVNVPSSQMLLYNRQTGKRYRRHREFFLYEYGSMDLQRLLHKIKLIISNCEVRRSSKQQNYRLFLAMPTSLSDQLLHVRKRYNATHIEVQLQHIFYPHLSTEAFPDPYGRHSCDIHPSDINAQDTCILEGSPAVMLTRMLRQFSSFMHQFGLALYEIQINRRKLEGPTLKIGKGAALAPSQSS